MIITYARIAEKHILVITEMSEIKLGHPKGKLSNSKNPSSLTSLLIKTRFTLRE